ncbi:hypothetical protein [Nocardiopsis coralliicola]
MRPSAPAPGSPALLAALVLCASAASCTGDRDEPPPGGIDTSQEAYTGYSGVELPDGVDGPSITAAYDAFDSPVYTVAFTGTPEQAETVCEGIGNWLVDADGVSGDEQERFGIPDASLEAAEGSGVRGCGAMNMDHGIQTDGIVLYPDADTAEVYLRSHDIPR